MKVKIDATLCSGNGRCWEYGKHVYELDDNGYNAQRGKICEVPVGREDEARTGARNCPEGAIQVIED